MNPFTDKLQGLRRHTATRGQNRERAQAMREENQGPPQTALQGIAQLTNFVPGIGDAAGLAADAEMYATDPESRNWVNYALSGAGMLPFVPSAAMVKAFHGSPYKFDKFSLDYIGTGEGEQAYGHGLYFAENPDVARQYREALTRVSPDADSRVVLRVDGKEIDTMSLPDDPINSRINDYINAWDDDLSLSSKDIDIDDALDDVAFDMKQELSSRWSTDEDKSFAESVLKRIDEMRGKDITLGIDDTGNLYNVKLDVNHEDLLDWDAPLSEQSGKVKEKIKNLVDSKFGAGYFDEYASDVDVRELIDNGFEDMSPPEVSAMLKDAGIPGIRYLDGGSRGAGEGTRNLVIFDDSLIDIVE
tara:strand:+ start:1422 stop:2498 length:1077 start_codon:yes stop_codon:yes gene_type:complete